MTRESRHSFAEILSRQPMFRGLSELERAQLAMGCREVRTRKNEVLFHKGDNPEGMHVVVMGQMKLSIPSSQGVEKIVHMCGPGATFGEAVVFLDKPYPVSAQAMTDGRLLLISRPVLLEAMDSNPLLSRKMLASLSARLHELLGDMESCTMRTSMQRVVCYLMQAAPAGESPEFEVVLQASKQNIASQMNLAPETLSRVLSDLSEKNLIKVKGRIITVLDRKQLRHFIA